MPDIGKDSDFTRVEDRREGQEAHGKAVEKFMTTAPRVDQVISLQTKMRLAWTFSPPFKAEYSEIDAVFDFYTGRIKRSHPVFQKLGLEWLPRLLQ